MLSAFAFARFASGLISGKLVDTFGERTVYTFGVALVSISSLACALSTSFIQLTLFRAAGGLGSSMFSVAAGSILLRATDDHHRGRAQSLYNGAFLLGMVGGPVIGGLLSAISLRAPMAIYAVLLAISSTAGGFLLRNSTLAARPSSSQESFKIVEALRLKPYLMALAVSFGTGWIIFGMSRSILPLFMVEKIDLTAGQMSVGFTVASIANGALLLYAGKLSDIKGRRFVAVIGTSLLTLSTALMIVTYSNWTFILSMFFSGVAGAFLSTVPGSLVGDVIKGSGGKVIALMQMSGDFAAMLSPVILGAIADGPGFRPAFAISTILMAGIFVIATRIPETRGKVHATHISN